MGITQPWNIVFMAGFVIYVGIRGTFARRTKENNHCDRRVGTQEKLLLSFVMVTGLLFPVVYLLTSLFSFANYDLPEQAHWIGLICMSVALWLFWRSHHDLGLNWSATLEVREDHQVVDGGVYGKIRHPMYLAIWLFCIAQGLLLDNWFAGWSVTLAFGTLYSLRVPNEERMMLEQFGPVYQDYMQKTGRLVPILRFSDK